jgi:hypothetical protein
MTGVLLHVTDLANICCQLTVLNGQAVSQRLVTSHLYKVLFPDLYPVALVQNMFPEVHMHLSQFPYSLQ